jgi:hypothetical protein
LYGISSCFDNFDDYNFLILYNMSMREVIKTIAYLLVLVFIGCASVYCVFLLLSLIKAMGL